MHDAPSLKRSALCIDCVIAIMSRYWCMTPRREKERERESHVGNRLHRKTAVQGLRWDSRLARFASKFDRSFSTTNRGLSVQSAPVGGDAGNVFEVKKNRREGHQISQEGQVFSAACAGIKVKGHQGALQQDEAAQQAADAITRRGGMGNSGK